MSKVKAPTAKNSVRKPTMTQPTSVFETEISTTKKSPDMGGMAYTTIGLVIGTATPNCCLVTYPENPAKEAQTALMLNHLPSILPGQSVLLQFLCADFRRPVIMGVLASPTVDTNSENTNKATSPTVSQPLSTIRLMVDDQTLTLQADKRLILQCGKASITLEADGNIEIRGKDLLSRASGQNAIRGASLTLN